jgi:hypothetical protein
VLAVWVPVFFLKTFFDCDFGIGFLFTDSPFEYVIAGEVIE